MKFKISKSTLRELYWSRNMSLRAIAELYKICWSTVRLKLVAFDIELRPATRPPLLLGVCKAKGCMKKPVYDKNAGRSTLCEQHSKEYHREQVRRSTQRKKEPRP